jgi:hypothetical protein
MAKLNTRMLILFTIIFAELMISYITHSTPHPQTDFSATAHIQSPKQTGEPSAN